MSKQETFLVYLESYIILMFNPRFTNKYIVPSCNVPYEISINTTTGFSKSGSINED